jgi:lipopolysaccharide transport protein LptA
MKRSKSGRLFFAVLILVGWIGPWYARAEEGGWSATNSTLISSKTMNFDSQRRRAVFHGDVVVKDPGLTILADSMTVMFDATNTPEMVTANGRVRILQPDRVAVCTQAVYAVKSGLLVLTGNPVLIRPGSRMTAKRMVFNRDEEKVSGDEVNIVFESTTNNLELLNLNVKKER